MYWYLRGFNPWAFLAWGIGFGLYHLFQRQTAWGSSIPSLVAGGVVYLIFMGLFGKSPRFRGLSKGEKT
jgi:hypothetical protein